MKHVYIYIYVARVSCIYPWVSIFSGAHIMTIYVVQYVFIWICMNMETLYIDGSSHVDTTYAVVVLRKYLMYFRDWRSVEVERAAECRDPCVKVLVDYYSCIFF